MVKGFGAGGCTCMQGAVGLCATLDRGFVAFFSDSLNLPE